MSKKPTQDQWEKIQKVFDAAVEADPKERSQIISRLTDDALVNDEVHSLLQYDQSECLPAIANHDAPMSTTRSAGESISGFRLLYPLSITNTSEVWCAERITDATRPVPALSASLPAKSTRVAIKFLRPEAENERRIKRFRIEAELLSQFRHPNIAEFIECGAAEDGALFIVTRFVPGTPVTEYADQRQLNTEQRAQLMARICDAVGYAHRFLAVHRDLKPSNILVSSDGQPVILDFGISKVLAPTSPTAAKLTGTQERPMTPAYASPEQVRGAPITTSTDLYSLGLIFYELMTGHHPYSSVAHPDIENLFDRICTSTAKLPSDIVGLSSVPLGSEDDKQCDSVATPRLIAALRGVSPAELRRHMRRGIDNVVSKAIAKSPDDRYIAVADFRRDLLNLAEHRPITAKVDHDRLRATVRRHPIKSLFTSAMLFGALALAAISFFWIRNANEQAAALTQSRQAELAAVERAEATEAKLASMAQMVDRVIAGDKEALSNAANVDTELASPGVLAAVARQAAEKMDFSLAKELLAKLPNMKSESLDTRRNVAATYQLLGLPAHGKRVLRDLTPEKSTLKRIQSESTDPNDLECTLIRLCVDVEFMDQANAWNELSASLDPVDQTPERRILAARTWARGGWDEGANATIKKLNSADNDSSILTAEQKARVRLIHARLLTDAGKPLAVSELAKRLPKVEAKTGSAFCLRGETSLFLAESYAEKEQWNDAAKVLSKLIQDCEAAKVPDHRLTRKATWLLASIAEKQQDTEQAVKLLHRAWDSAVQADELKTKHSIFIAREILRISEDADEIIGIMDQLLTDTAAFSSTPYLERDIRRAEFWAISQTDDWPRALASSNRLVQLEEKLWDRNTLSFAFASAANSLALDKTGDPDAAEKMLSAARNALTNVNELANDRIASAFFAPVLQSTEKVAGAKRHHEWIRMYEMHLNNPPKVQLEMVTYEAEQIAQSDPEVSMLLVKVAWDKLKKQKDISDLLWGRLRLAKLAKRFGQVGEAKSELTALSKSADEQVAKEALSMLEQLKN